LFIATNNKQIGHHATVWLNTVYLMLASRNNQVISPGMAAPAYVSFI